MRFIFVISFATAIFFLFMGIYSLLCRSAVGEAVEKARRGRKSSGDFRRRLAEIGGMISNWPLIRELFNPEALERKLLMAGANLSPVEFLGLQAACTAGGALLASLSGRGFVIMGPALMLVGFAMPRSFLDRRSGEAVMVLERDFVLYLQKISQCITAGMSFDRAALRASSGLCSFLRTEVHSIVENIRGGVPEDKAVSIFAGRLNIPDADNFARVVRNGLRHGDERFGSLLVDLARNMMAQRDSRSFEVAKKLEYQLLPYGVLSLMPASFLLIGAPLIVAIARVFL